MPKLHRRRSRSPRPSAAEKKIAGDLPTADSLPSRPWRHSSIQDTEQGPSQDQPKARLSSVDLQRQLDAVEAELKTGKTREQILEEDKMTSTASKLEAACTPEAAIRELL